MKVSARNAFHGKIVEITEGATTAHVVIDANGMKITAAITNEAVEELGLKLGENATAIIKASEVIIAVD